MLVTGNSECLCGDTHIYALHSTATKNTSEIKKHFPDKKFGLATKSHLLACVPFMKTSFNFPAEKFVNQAA